MEANFDIADDELQIFLAEANEHLQVLDEGFVRLEREGDDPPLLQALFRSAHTLKGSAGAIGHRRMAELTHAMETVLDGLRKETASVNVRLMDALLESLDALRVLLQEVVDRQVSGVEVSGLVAHLAEFSRAASGLSGVPQLAAASHGPSLPKSSGAPPAGAAMVESNGHAAAKLISKPANGHSPKPKTKPSPAAKSPRASTKVSRAVDANGHGAVKPGSKSKRARRSPIRPRSGRPEAASALEATPPAPAPVVTVRADFAPGGFASAARAFQIILALQEIGALLQLEPDQATIETSAPVEHFLARVETQRPVEAVRQALDGIPDILRLTVQSAADEAVAASAPVLEAGPAPVEPAAAVEAGQALPINLDEATQRLGDFLVSAGHITAAQLQAAIQKQAAEKEPHHLLGYTLVQMGFLPQAVLDQALAQQISQLRTALQSTQATGEKGRRVTEQTVRTSVERLDSLMNLVGELITGRNRLYQLHHEFEQRWRGEGLIDELNEAALRLGRLTDQLQEEVMRIRMLPIASVFNKFPRLVRDLARQTGKKVELVIRGEDTELDRSVIESIGDPLIHMVRNSIDHGIELPEERLALGKPEQGTVHLTARHEEGRIILTIEDDGAGIDTEKVKASAVRKGLITEAEAAAMTTGQAIDLIFAPGLSTAKVISGLSGRGVGMDIVRSNIEHLNGTVSVETRLGHGTKFQVALPLTLAILPALLVQTGQAREGGSVPIFAIPLTSVMEALQITTDEIDTIRGQAVTLLRGSVLPLLRLDEALGFEPAPALAANAREYVVAVRWGKAMMGLRVDRLVGEQEIVIKSLGTMIGETVGVAGAAILGDGQIALITDVPGLFKRAGV